MFDMYKPKPKHSTNFYLVWAIILVMLAGLICALIQKGGH